ncbi:AAA family ATPase [Bdellovibrionota bacterium FG-2]
MTQHDRRGVNPFITGSPIEEEALYCPRKEDAELRDKLLSSTNNLYIAEERRIGKTSLVRMTIKRSKAFTGFYVDLSNSPTFRSLINQMMSLDRALSLTATQREKFSHLREDFKRAKERDEDELKHFLLQTLTAMKDTRTTNKQPVLILDEFQEISEIGEKHLRDTLRNFLQGMKDLRVIFLGSVRSDMEKLFATQGELFYGAAERFHLSLIPINDFYKFITTQLLRSSWQLDKQIFSELYRSVYGITEDVQRVLAEMFDQARIKRVTHLDNTLHDYAIQKLINDRSKSFDRDFSELSAQQKKVLIIIATQENVPVDKIIKFSSTLERTQFVQETLVALVNKKLISEYSAKGMYQFYDPFFKLWLRQKFANITKSDL